MSRIKHMNMGETEKLWPMVWLWIVYIIATIFFLAGPVFTMYGVALGGWAWIIFLAISTLYPVFFMFALLVISLGTTFFYFTYRKERVRFGTAAILYGEIMAIMVISCIHYILPYGLEIMPPIWVFPAITGVVALAPIVAMIVLHVRKKKRSGRISVKQKHQQKLMQRKIFRTEIVLGALSIAFVCLTIGLTLQGCNLFSC